MNRNDARLIAALALTLAAALPAPSSARVLAPRAVTRVGSHAPRLTLALPRTGLAASAASLAASGLASRAGAPALPAAAVPAAARREAPERKTCPAAATAARVESAAQAVQAAIGDGQVEKGGSSSREAGAAVERALTGAAATVQGVADESFGPDAELAAAIKQRSAFVPRFREQFARSIVGQEELRDSLLIGLLAGGNVLLEGVPGVAKTRAVKTIGRMLELKSGRVQFTRDLQPAEITGQEELDKKTNEWGVRKGPIFVDMLLADEINRARGQTQSGMLQAMEERFVTIAGVDYPLSELFFVVATQNPIEEDGVHPLPKAQFDRFMFKVDVPNPTQDELKRIVMLKHQEGAAPEVEQVLTRAELVEIRDLVRRVKVSEDIAGYVSRLVEATHERAGLKGVHDKVRQGSSPRGAEWLTRAAQAVAFIEGRHYVDPDDVKAVAHRVLRHRILLDYDAEGETSTDELVDRVLQSVPVAISSR